MSDASAGGVKVNPMRACELFDKRIFKKVLVRAVLYVMVEGEHGLGWVVDTLSANRLEPDLIKLLLQCN